MNMRGATMQGFWQGKYWHNIRVFYASTVTNPETTSKSRHEKIDRYRLRRSRTIGREKSLVICQMSPAQRHSVLVKFHEHIGIRRIYGEKQPGGALRSVCIIDDCQRG